MRFIGSKERLLPFIEDAFVRYVGKGKHRVGDPFCGTATVSRLFKRLGNKVIANDNLKLGYVFANSALNINSEPGFALLIKSGEISSLSQKSLYFTPYDQVLTFLNMIPMIEGFFAREYSPSGAKTTGIERRYFSDENAGRIDAIRAQLSRWNKTQLLTETEHCLLLADLMRATNRVANIAGTYGCFIKHWDARALRPLKLERSAITPGILKHNVFCNDANELVRKLKFDVLYLDPPYTWRHYGAYYHILETIAQEDEPVVSGKTGLRPWQQSKSVYCDRENAVNALRNIISFAKTEHLFLSYNNEGLISHDQILDALKKRGDTRCMEIGYRRYRSNNGGSMRNHLKERLYYVKIK
jgi:adenine-specific DNA-methyltransferase